jgi:hypothetical protein
VVIQPSQWGLTCSGPARGRQGRRGTVPTAVAAPATQTNTKSGRGFP